jgi:hypothetical protein
VRTYKRTMHATGVLGALLGVGYLVAASLAAAEGEVLPQPVSSVMWGIVLLLAALSCTAWLVDRNNRVGSETYVRPMIRTELEQAREEFCAAIADKVAEQLRSELTELQEREALRVAESVSRLTLARIREVIADEVEDRMQHVLNTGRRHGMVLEAQTHRITNPPAAPKAANGSTVRHFPRQPGADER